MKPQLTLRIDKFLEGETLAAGAIVQVRSLQESGSSRVLHRVPVPVTDNSSVHSTVAVDPGRYEVSAVLPSGSVISRVIDVLADDGTVDATLDGGSSPHEWLAWQQWSGNVGERSVARPSPAKSAQSAQPAKSAAVAPPAARAPASAPAVAGADAGADAGEDAGADTGADAAAPQMVPDAIELVSVSPLSGGTREPVWQRLAQQLAELDALQSIDAASIMPPGVSSHTLDIMQDPPYVAVRLPRHAGHTGHRSYLTVSMGGHTMLCVVPWPWGRTDGSSEALVEAVVSVDGDGDNEWSVRTTVRDPMIAGVLSYFVAGEARTARELMGPALDLLYGKMTNPL
ncbi:MAG TPA: hypothetical protein VMN60_04805, partial [Longimicrobiales bacterium]|nr:hypothetical protein [Longimicrobiales bacterium]